MVMKLSIAQKWLRTIAWLRRNFPAQRRVVVQTKATKELRESNGLSSLDKGEFLIEISRKQSYNLRMDALMHEWAHILTWFGESFRSEEHSAEWGVAYAKILRTWLEWNYGREEKGSD